MAARPFFAPAFVGCAVAAGLLLSQAVPAVRAGRHTSAALSVPPQAAAEPTRPTARAHALPDEEAPPASATFVWGPQRFAEGAPAGLVPALTADAAVAVYRRDAMNGRLHAGLQPELHLWLYTDELFGISRKPAWVLFYRNVSEVPVSVPEGVSSPANGVYTGCWESYVIDATTGRGLSNTTECPDQR